MSHFLTEEQQLMQKVARDFAQNEVEPLAVDIDKNDEIPLELTKRCAELNFFGIMIPEQYGGLGADITTACVVLEEIGKASPAMAGMLSVQIALCPVCISSVGTEDQKKRFLVPSASGEKLMALSQTEPSGVGNIMAHETRLTADGDHYRLNGLKIFCTQGTAVNYLVACRTSQDGQEGYGEVMVERGMEGFEIGKYENKLGWRGSNTGTIIFKNVRIPKENVVGRLLSGNQDIGLGNLTGNLGHSAAALGCAEGMYAKTIAYVKERKLYGMPMPVLQPISYWIADIYTKLEASRAMLYDAARLIEMGRIDPNLVMGVKVYVCETALEITNKCLQLWGGHGIMNDVGVNRYMRDARTNTIAEGSSEILLSAISQAVLS